MRITSKGQVTVPKHIRDKLGIGPGDDIGFREEGQAVIVETGKNRVPANKGRALVQHLQKMGKRAKRIPMTTEELMELTRGPFDASDTH